jgi:ComF family protein
MSLLDWFFEKECSVCKQPGEFLCPDCYAKIERVERFVCPECMRINTNGGYCHLCSERHELSGILEACKWEEPLRSVVHEFKYTRHKFLSKDLSKLLSERVDKTRYIGFDLVTFVPLHPLRRFWRGFNQAELLAKQISLHLGLPLIRTLKRKKFTKPQVKLSGTERRKALKEKFGLIDLAKIKGKRILLIDDISTTGSTLEECAKVLRPKSPENSENFENSCKSKKPKNIGAESVWGLVLARG